MDSWHQSDGTMLKVELGETGTNGGADKDEGTLKGSYKEPLLENRNDFNVVE